MAEESVDYIVGEALVPVEQQTVEFYDDELTAVRTADGRVYVAIRQMCIALGLDPQAQRRRMSRHGVLSDGLKVVAKLATTFGVRDAYVLRVDLVPLWMTGVRTSSVKEETRPKLVRFQKEAAAVLWDAFQDGRLTSDLAFDELLAQDTPEAQAYKLAHGVMRLARNQMLMRGRLDDHEQRLETIEATLGDPGRNITADQASQVSQAVKAVAMELSKINRSNQYGAVYGEMYRKFGITSYKLLPAGKFEEAMGWLTDWYQRLVGEEAPF